MARVGGLVDPDRTLCQIGVDKDSAIVDRRVEDPDILFVWLNQTNALVERALHLDVLLAIIIKAGEPRGILDPVPVLIRARQHHHVLAPGHVLLLGESQRKRSSFQISRQGAGACARLQASVPLDRHQWPTIARTHDMGLHVPFKLIVECRHEIAGIARCG